MTWGRWFFRIRGYGVRVVNHRTIPALHVERSGHMPTVHLGRWCFGWVRP